MRRSLFFWIVLIAAAVLGTGLLWYSTTNGMGLVNDSVAYVSGARSLLAGGGYGRPAGNGDAKPITHFPPLFSLVLAAAGLTGTDAVPAARWVNLAQFFGNILLVGLLARRASRSNGLGLLGAGLFGCSAALLSVHSFALSEPLFLFLTLAGLLCLLHYFDTGPREGSWRAGIGWLVAAGVLAGLSYLTRYVGGALFAVVVLALLLFHRTWRNRLASIGIFLVASLPWVIAWSVRNTLLTGSATNRVLNWHPVTAANLSLGLSNFWAFALPSRLDLYPLLPQAVWAALALLLLAVIAAGVLLAGLRLLRGSGSQSISWAAFLAGLHLLAYLGYVLFSMSLVDASTTFEDRILSPVYADLIIVGVWALAVLWARRSAWYRWAVPALAVLLLLSFVDDARKSAAVLHLQGQGFASTQWTNSELMAAARKLPPVVIYTNKLSAVTLLAERPAYALLDPMDPVTQEERPDYDQASDNIRQAVKNGKAVLVVFSAQPMLKSTTNPWFREFTQGLPVLAEYADGMIFGVLP